MDNDGQGRNLINRQEVEHWEGMLEWELSNLPNLKYVLIIGSYALRALTLENKITDWRGSILDVKIGNRWVKAVCAFNPAHVIREPRWEPIFKFDINKLYRLMKGEDVSFPVQRDHQPVVQRGDAVDREDARRQAASVVRHRDHGR